jgi:hypothetical protein
MTGDTRTSWIDSRWGRAVSLLAYTSCFVSGFARHNWFLVGMGVLGYALVVWRLVRGPRRPPRPRNREEAIEQLYPRRWRVLAGLSVAVLLVTTLGVLTILGGARRDDSPDIVMGSVLVLTAALMVAATVRVVVVLRAHARASHG